MGDNEGRVRKTHRRKIFVKDGRPVRFFLQPCINRESQRQKLRVDIEVHENQATCHLNIFFDAEFCRLMVDASLQLTTVLMSVLIGATRRTKSILRLRYGVDDDKYKESYTC
jgi:hypothetical protein